MTTASVYIGRTEVARDLPADDLDRFLEPEEKSGLYSLVSMCLVPVDYRFVGLPQECSDGRVFTLDSLEMARDSLRDHLEKARIDRDVFERRLRCTLYQNAIDILSRYIDLLQSYRDCAIPGDDRRATLVVY